HVGVCDDVFSDAGSTPAASTTFNSNRGQQGATVGGVEQAAASWKTSMR
ncbi:MAG: hypothetical protein RJA55_1541, partial [Acidobacteriota bacterium]